MVQAKQLQVFKERNAPVSHSLPSMASHTGGKSIHTPRNRAGPLLPEWLTSSVGLRRERWITATHQRAGTKATVNHQVGISPSVFQGEEEPAIHKRPMYSPGVKNLPAKTGDKRNVGSTPGGHGGGHGTPLQYSCLGNPMDRGGWRATSHRVAKSRTRMKRLGTQAVCSPI